MKKIEPMKRKAFQEWFAGLTDNSIVLIVDSSGLPIRSELWCEIKPIYHTEKSWFEIDKYPGCNRNYWQTWRFSKKTGLEYGVGRGQPKGFICEYTNEGCELLIQRNLCEEILSLVRAIDGFYRRLENVEMSIEDLKQLKVLLLRFQGKEDS